MVNKLKNIRAQHLSEYAIVIGMIIAVLLAMRPFISRSIQAHVLDSLTYFGDPTYAEPYNPLFGPPDTVTSTFTRTATSNYETSGDDGIEQNLAYESSRGVGYSEEMTLLGESE